MFPVRYARRDEVFSKGAMPIQYEIFDIEEHLALKFRGYASDDTSS